MDYEKAYKDALDRARKMMNSKRSVVIGKQALETIFPELRESEDERIRKMCITSVNIAASADGGLLHHEAKQCLDWLEKQKDINCLACDQYLKGYLVGRKVTEEEKQKEHKPILGVFGFKVGDAVRLKDGDGRKHIIKSFEEVEGIHGPNFYRVEFEDNSARDGIYPGEEYPNGYYTRMEKFEEEQKPAEWSEEDEDMLNSCISSIEEAKENRYAYKETDGDTSYDREIAWLKSLRPSWKPSEEQMKALKRCVDGWTDDGDGTLDSLYNDLKKLM